MRLRTALLAVGAVLAGCADDGPEQALDPTELCTAVQAWSDATVDAVNAFRIDSRELEPASRRDRYAQAFTDLGALRDEFAEHLADLDLDEDIAGRLDDALVVVGQTYSDGADEAAALPDEDYEFVAVRDGSLVTGSEKARAVVLSALNQLSAEPGSTIPRGCGRRGALDLSPSVTYP